MNDYYGPKEAELAGKNVADYASYYRFRNDYDWGLVQDALEIIYATVSAIDDEDLRSRFSWLHNALQSELSEESPHLEVCRLWTAACHSYFQANYSKRAAADESLKDAVIAQLELNLPQHLNARNLLRVAITLQLESEEEPESASPSPDRPY